LAVGALVQIAAAPAVLVASSATAATIEINVNGLVCAICAQGIEKRLRKLPATAHVVVSLEQRLVAVALKDGQGISDADLRKALSDAGDKMVAIQRTDEPIDAVRARVKQRKP
jgi:copper chaperone CopZ